MGASEYVRSSAIRDPRELPAEFREAVLAHAELVGAHDPLGSAHTACLTSSVPAGGGGFLRRRKGPYDTWLVLGDDLLTVVTDASGGPVVSIYRLGEVEVKRFDSPLVHDTGLDVVGAPMGATERSSAFLPLDEGDAGRGFETELARSRAGRAR